MLGCAAQDPLHVLVMLGTHNEEVIEVVKDMTNAQTTKVLLQAISNGVEGHLWH